jgi:hypothetical protein
MYGKKCRCRDCVAANAEYKRLYKIGATPGQRARRAADPPPAPSGPGAVEYAVSVELDGLPPGPAPRLSLIELAKALARDVDNPNLVASHPSLARELRSVLSALHSRAAGGTGAKLALVTEMTKRP